MGTLKTSLFIIIYYYLLLTLSGPGGRGREKMSALISTLRELPCYLTLSSQGADSAPFKGVFRISFERLGL